jgi:hypothetical protein
MAGHIHVKDEFRTNQLSLQPGGHTVTVTYEDGSKRSYDKVKDPARYINSIEARGIGIREVLVDGEPFNWKV